MKKQIQKTLMVVTLLATSTITFAQKATDDFSGKWKTDDGKIITVTKSSEGFVGKADDNKTVILYGVKFSDKKWSGVVTNPKENKTAKCELILESGKLKITAKKGIMSKIIIWTKIK